MNKWVRKIPDTEGWFWFYGYRYGKITCGTPCEPELILMQNTKISKGFMLVGAGQFVFENELEDAHFLPAILPDLPEIKE